jgi:hypothetical protein
MENKKDTNKNIVENTPSINEDNTNKDIVENTTPTNIDSINKDNTNKDIVENTPSINEDNINKDSISSSETKNIESISNTQSEIENKETIYETTDKIKKFQNEYETIFILPFSEFNLKTYTDDYFTSNNINATISILINRNDEIKGGNKFNLLDYGVPENSKLTIPYKFFHYKLLYLKNKIRGNNNDYTDNDKLETEIKTENNSTFVDTFNGLYDKISGFLKSISSKKEEDKPIEEPTELTPTEPTPELTPTEPTPELTPTEPTPELTPREEDKEIKIVVRGEVEEINTEKEKRYVYWEKILLILKKGERIDKEKGVYIIDKKVSIYNKVEGDEEIINNLENSMIWKEYQERD